MTSNNHSIKLIESFYHDLWNKFDKSLITKILDPNLSFRGSLGDKKLGHHGFAEYVDKIKDFSTDFHNEILEVITDGDKYFVKLKFSGHQSGEIFGIKATNKKFSYYGAATFKFKNNLIAEIWVLGDVFGLLRQLQN